MAAGKEFSMGEEFAGLDFHSIRLEKRFIGTMKTLIKQPDKSIWYSSEDRAEAKAIYRMLGNDAFDREEIARAHRTATIRRMAGYGGTILAVQDTTGVNYDNRLKTEGIGYISDKTLGVNVHTCLAVTADGLVLGVLDQSSYNRSEAKDDSATHDRKKIRPIEESETKFPRKVTGGWKPLNGVCRIFPKVSKRLPSVTGKGICTNCLPRQHP